MVRGERPRRAPAERVLVADQQEDLQLLAIQVAGTCQRNLASHTEKKPSQDLETRSVAKFFQIFIPRTIKPSYLLLLLLLSR